MAIDKYDFGGITQPVIHNDSANEKAAEVYPTERDNMDAGEWQAEEKRQEAEKEKMRLHDEQTAGAIWEAIAAKASYKRFNLQSGKIENITGAKNADAVKAEFFAQFKNKAEKIEVPPEAIADGKIIDSILAQWGYIYGGYNNSPIIRIEDDPPFENVQGLPVYTDFCRYWVLNGNALYMAFDITGAAFERPIMNYEGYKAKQARLKAEAEARAAEEKQLADIEAEEKEKARRASNLERLSAMPENLINKLFGKKD